MSQRARCMEVLKLREQGVSHKEAILKARIGQDAFYSWLRKLKDSTHAYDQRAWVRWLQITGIPCDMCGALMACRTWRGRQEHYCKTDITLRFCSERCELKWDIDDPNSRRGIDPADLLTHPRGCNAPRE